MEKKTLRFKTNVNCSACVRAVTPHMDKASGVEAWEVDTDNPDKILTVESSGATAEEVVQVIKKAGFEAEAIG